MALKIRKEFTVMVAVPSAVSCEEVVMAAHRSSTEIAPKASEHSWTFEATPSTIEGVHAKPDMGLSCGMTAMKLRGWSPGTYDWSTFGSDEDFQKATGREPPEPDKRQSDFFPSDS